MSAQVKDTEILILNAAREVFIRNGYEGTTMQMIADQAGINKALLHYYYRNKDRLFEGIFREAFGKMAPKLQQILFSDLPFPEKIRVFVNEYISTLMESPEIPIFILHEIHRNPERIIENVSKSGINPDAMQSLIENEVKKGTIRPVDSVHLLVNMLALCIFPFAARPIIKGFILKNNQEKFNHFMEDRKTEVTDFIINSLRK